MVAKPGPNLPRSKRGARAFTDAEEWAIYGRVEHGNERVEALATEFEVSGRTIENVMRRRRAAIAKAKALDSNRSEGGTNDTEGSASTAMIPGPQQ